MTDMGNTEIMPLKYVTNPSIDSTYYSLLTVKTSNIAFLNIYFEHVQRVAASSQYLFNDLCDLLESGTLIRDAENKSFYIKSDFEPSVPNELNVDDLIQEGINIEYHKEDYTWKLLIVEKDSPLIGTAFKGLNDEAITASRFIYDKVSLLNYLEGQTADIKFTGTSTNDIGYKPKLDYLSSNKVVGASSLFKYTELLREKFQPRLPEGEVGQVLAKTSTGVEWKDSGSKEEKVFYIKCEESIQNDSYVCQVTNTQEEIKEIVSYAAENSNYKIIVQNSVGANMTSSIVFYNKSRKTLIISSAQNNIPDDKFINADNKYDEYSSDLVYYITLYESGEYDANLYRESVVRKFRYIELDSDTQLSSLDGYFVNSSVGEIHYIIKNTSSNTIVITLPSNGEIKYSNVEQIEIEPGSVSEINIIFTSRQKFIRAV